MKHFDEKQNLALEQLDFEVAEPEPITTEKAYQNTLKSIERLNWSLAEYRIRGGLDLQPEMRQLVMDSMAALIEEWSQQARDYEALKTGRTSLGL
ncbi:hypothetical protein EON83_21170 [bacterium]|nr:MAG: hypothetical protein EON83_21170 [bacterium]